MNVVKNRQGDALNNLNVDESEITFKEKSMLDMLYPMTPEVKTPSAPVSVSPPSTVVIPRTAEMVQAVETLKDGSKVWKHFNDIIIATGLFVLLSLPFADGLIAKVVKIDDPNYRLAAKAALFALVLFIVHNFYLSRVGK